MKFTRRMAIQMGAASTLLPAAAESLEGAQVPQAPKESSNSPKIAVGMGDAFVGGGGRGRGAGAGAPAVDPTEGPRRIKQLGVNHVLSGGPQTPWTEESLN